MGKNLKWDISNSPGYNFILDVKSISLFLLSLKDNTSPMPIIKPLWKHLYMLFGGRQTEAYLESCQTSMMKLFADRYIANELFECVRSFFGVSA